MKKKILFVDDESNVLQGLQRMLRGLRNEWEMSFAASGPEALECLSKEPFEVIVSDIRMPGMDGAQLLTEVKRRYPEIVRIVLSGHLEQDKTLQLVRPAHQYLAKPCDPEELKLTVMRACSLRNLLFNKKMKALVADMESLPSLPSLYLEIMEEINSPNFSAQKVGKIISRDVAMTAKILQLINSSFFGLRQHVSNPSQAVVLLGMEIIKALVISIQVFNQFDPRSPFSSFLDRLWTHSFAIGAFAKRISEEEKVKKDVVEDSFTAGLLHDLGKLIFAINFAEQYKKVQAVAREKSISSWEAEMEVIGSTHSEVGAYLLGIWGLSDRIVEALAYHHCPGNSEGKNFSPMVAVHVADFLEYQENGLIPEAAPQIDDKFLASLDLTDRLAVWKQACQEAMKQEELDG